MLFTGDKYSPLNSVVVKTHRLFTSHGGHDLIVQCTDTGHLIKLTLCDITKKRAHDSQIFRAKENFKLSQVGPSQRPASGTNQRIQALRQGCH